MRKGSEGLQPSDFVHLHTHTHYSLLDGLTKIPKLTKRVKELGMDSVAVTDHGSMSGSIEFYKAAKADDIKPVIGMEAYVAPRGYQDRDPARDRQYFHLTMLAMSNKGYQNLMKLATLASLEGFYYKPRIDRKLIEKYNDGLIILSGCMGGEVSDSLQQGDYQKAKDTAQWYKKIFGNRYYIELADHGHPNHPTVWKEQTTVNKQLLQIASELDIPAVVTCDSHYLEKDDQQAHEVLLCVQTGAFLSDEQRMSLADFDLHVADPKEVIKRWGVTHPELIKNTKKISEQCDVHIEMGEILIPKFPTPKGETEKSLLEKMVWQGLAWRYGGQARSKTAKLSSADAKKTLTKDVIDRAEYELSVVSRMGFNGYFLIVADFINWGKDQSIVFGPGRGSAASSIMAYGLRITEIDPLRYDLLFERFLNPDRISMPDMDIDIQDNRRDEVINYCVEKYGRDRVANIVTFGQMAARNSVRDVARVLQVPYAEADRLAKMIPPPNQGRHTPLARHLKEVEELKREYRDNKRSAKIFELAIKLEGTIRSHGVHAAGVVITPDEIVNYVPLEMAQKGVVATQYSMGPIEDMGLLKMDFLGLSNLTTIKNTLRIVKKVYKEEINIDLIPLDDDKTYQMLKKGETTGIFQLESSGMRRYLKQLKPSVFEDIIAMVALYRPGPMQWIEDFIARKHGRRKIEYMHPAMKSALENTYGVIVYQEQVMQISKEMCGFSGGQADTLRKGIAKKIPEVLSKMKQEFIDGAVIHSGADRRLMEKFWTQLEEFGNYGFNKVHSACYGLIAYQTAYLKAHYPDAFMASLMTTDYDNTDRLAIEIAECKGMGIEVLPPDVNESFHEFAVVPGKNQIRFGLDAVKNVGHGAVEEILRAREAAGSQFESIEDYCRLVSPGVVNKKSLESLAKAGAFDRFESRGRLVASVDNILAHSNRIQKNEASGQVDLFGASGATSELQTQVTWVDPEPAYTSFEQLAWERELLGLYLSRHPLEDYEEILARQSVPIASIEPHMDGANVALGGSISEIREITTKNGAKMAFVKLADQTAEIEMIVFPKKYQSVGEVLQRDKVIIAKGKLSAGRAGDEIGELKLLVEEINLATSQPGPSVSQSSASSSKKRLYIRLPNSEDRLSLLTLKKKLDSYKGKTEVVLVTGEEQSKQAIKLPQTIDVNESSLRDLASVFGASNVVIR